MANLVLPHRKPLLGDSDGTYKIAIVGNSGTGKTTLAVELSKLLNIPYLSLDEVHWNPGWKEAPPEEFKHEVETFLASHLGGWIIDGNYTSQIGTLVQDHATDVLWLDPPLILNFWRTLVRTFRRIFLKEPGCAPGCEERISEALGSKDSILLWCLTHHSIARERFTDKWKRQDVEEGKGKWRRFGGWGSSLDNWMNWVRNTIRST